MDFSVDAGRRRTASHSLASGSRVYHTITLRPSKSSSQQSSAEGSKVHSEGKTAVISRNEVSSDDEREQQAKKRV